jgi:hypothetical protein
MKSKPVKALIALLIIAIGYAGSYLAIRMTRTDKNGGNSIVVFPNDTLAALYKPMSAMDKAMTGAGSRVGQAEEAPAANEQ